MRSSRRPRRAPRNEPCLGITRNGGTPAEMWSLQFGRRPLAGDRPGGGGRAVGVPDYEFLLAEAPEAVWAALGSRYSVVAGARSHRTRVLLDTFDGRLRTA